MPLNIRVTVEGDGPNKAEAIRLVYDALAKTGLPMEPASRSGPRPALRAVTASGEQQR